jgi:hypothetical protein
MFSQTYKYFSNELNNSKVKVDHSHTIFTNHMKCNLYNSQNKRVGFLTTRNNYHRIFNKYLITATSTYNIFNRGIIVVCFAYMSSSEHLDEIVENKPMFASKIFYNKNVNVKLEGKPNGLHLLTLSF